MSKPKVTIKRFIYYEDGRVFTYEEVHLVLNGEVIGVGNYGGEPEDNMRIRDYSWVEPMLTALAEKLGAEVEIVEEKAK